MHVLYDESHDDAQASADYQFVYPNISNRGSFWREFDDIACHLMSGDGPASFASSKGDAAIHAIGQAIIAASQDVIINYAMLFDIGDFGGQLIWAGITNCGRPPWQLGASLDADFQELNFRLAGSVAEIHFARDNYKSGSHLSDRVLSILLANRIAEKLDRDPDKFLTAQLDYVREIVVANESLVHSLAQSLMTSEELSGAALNSTLARVTIP